MKLPGACIRSRVWLAFSVPPGLKRSGRPATWTACTSCISATIPSASRGSASLTWMARSAIAHLREHGVIVLEVFGEHCGELFFELDESGKCMARRGRCHHRHVVPAHGQ